MSTRSQKGFARIAVAGLLTLAGTGCADLLSPSEKPQDQVLFLHHPDGNETGPWYSRATDIHRMNADGTGIENLTRAPAWYSSLSLSPDGKRVAFASDRSGTAQIWVMRTDGTSLRQLTTRGSAGVPRWSPDGALIAFEGTASDGRAHVFVVDADGGDPRNVSSPATGSCSATDTRTRISLIGWIPGGRVAFSRYVCGEGFRFYTVNADGSGFAQTDVDLNTAFWSPDGSRVAFTRREGFNQGLFVMNADGSGLRRLAEGPARLYLLSRSVPHLRSDYTPWSPDGRRIMFYSDTTPGVYSMEWSCNPSVINVDGSGLRPLADGFCGEFNGWSPDGERLAFTGVNLGERDIYMVNADGSEFVNVTRSPVPVSSAMWLRRR